MSIGTLGFYRIRGKLASMGLGRDFHFLLKSLKLFDVLLCKNANRPSQTRDQ
jgi:hypothetical protein